MDYEYTRFKVLFYGKKDVYHTIHNISVLATYIQTYGISSIRKIIFEFYRPLNNNSFYNNISLCNIGNNIFNVQFYYFYNSFNQLFLLKQDIQENDYYKLYYFLYHQPLLNTLLLPCIAAPIYNITTNDLKE